MPRLIARVGATAASIFSSARASPSGLRVSSAPDASARYSRRRDTIIASICATSGASRIATIQITKNTTPAAPPPRSIVVAPARPPPHHMPRRAQSDSSADGADQRGDDRHQADVEVADVAHLVRDDALQLLAIERIEQPARHRDRRVPGPRPVANAFGSGSGTM